MFTPLTLTGMSGWRQRTCRAGGGVGGLGVNVGVDVMFCRTLGACQDAMDGRKSLLSAAR